MLAAEALAAKSGLTVANTSQHLQALRRVGLVRRSLASCCAPRKTWLWERAAI